MRSPVRWLPWIALAIVASACGFGFGDDLGDRNPPQTQIPFVCPDGGALTDAGCPPGS